MARHPWELTVRELIEKVQHYYGIEIRTVSWGGGLFLTRGGKIYPLPSVDEDETLTSTVLREICKLYWLPPADFGLDPED